VEHGEVVLGLLLPADEDPAEAIQPGVGALDDPAAGAEAGLVRERSGFLAAGADVGSEAELGEELSDFVVVVALVEAEVLRRLGRRLGPLDRDALERQADELVVVAVGTADREPERDAGAFAEEAPFRPLLALSVGFGPVSPPPSGALPIAPSIASHSHSIPASWS
jgi:hypothetical protein